MKHLRCAVACALLLAAILGGCSRKDSDGAGGSSAAANDPTVISGKGDAQAVKALAEELAQRWVRAPEGWVSMYPSQTYLATGKRAGPDSFYREMKELKFEVEAGPLSESDKLNGIQYRGTATFSQTPARIYGDPNAFGPAKWSEWKGSFETVSMQKINGRWGFGNAMGYMVTGEKPGAAELGKIK